MVRVVDWIFDKVIRLLVSIFCAVVGLVVAWYIHAIIMEVCK